MGSSEASGVHDLGGRSGFGPVPVDDDALFHADWERRAFGASSFAQVVAGYNTDAFRHTIEREDPDVYLSVPYFEKWIRAAERMLVEGGVIAADAVPAYVAGRAPQAPVARTTDAVPPATRETARTVDREPRFNVGDRVLVAGDARSQGHTRLPGFVRGQTGEVTLVNGGWIYPDTHAHGRGEDPTWVYAVRFESGTLWPDDPGPGHAVVVDLFEPYLEAAQ